MKISTGKERRANCPTEFAMGIWSYHNIGVSAKAEAKAYAEQVLYCLFPAADQMVCGVEDSLMDEYNPDLKVSAEGAQIKAKELFFLMNALLGSTCVYAEEGDVNTVCGYYRREESIYDPVAMVFKYAEQTKDYGGCVANWDCWSDSIDHDRLHRRLKQAGIYDRLNEEFSDAIPDLFDDCTEALISWDSTWEDLEESLQDAFGTDLGNTVYQIFLDLINNPSDDSSGSKIYISENNIKAEPVSASWVKTLAEAAAQKGYTELLALIREKLL